MQNDAVEWLKRAKSNLERGKDSSYLDLRDISLADLCFDLQQCAEKSFKALLVYHNIDFPKTHSISALIEILEDNNISVPEELINSSDLTVYAVQTRYPFEMEPMTVEEHKEAFDIAEKVYNWVSLNLQT
jgi:HEPN domain-containing protein